MARKLGLFRSFNGKRYTREGIRPTKNEAEQLASRLRDKGYSTRIIPVSSSISRKGYVYAIYARG